MHTRSQCLTNSLFRCETTRYFEHLATTLLDLLFRKDTLQEAFSMMGEDATDTLDLCPLCENKLCAAAAVPRQAELFGRCRPLSPYWTSDREMLIVDEAHAQIRLDLREEQLACPY